jgi:glycine/D-amino acid oxidase-like deaminating enzyme
VQTPASLWWSTLSGDLTTRTSLPNDLDCDVVIVGGGFTGLWTARQLLERDASLRIVILEKHHCGFGASGRNGGWASALYPLSDKETIREVGLEGLHHQQRVLNAAVTNLGSSLARDHIDADFVQGGTLTFARTPVHVTRLKENVTTQQARGFAPDNLQWIDHNDLNEYGVVDGALGATFSPHCARLHPVKVVRGLANAVESRGVTIFEETTVTRILPATKRRRASVTTIHGTVRADVVVRATEGFTPTISGHQRDVAPVYSLMVATDVLPASFWRTYGFDRFPTFADDRNLIIYGQRTADGRLAFGGRGAPYHFGSSVEPRFDQSASVFAALEETLRELFPTLDTPITHRWGGPLAMPRDLSPSVAFDARSGLAYAGGYTGDGVVLSYVAGTALADLIATPDAETDYTRLPMVQHPLRKWEVEPFRWLGINAGLRLADTADRFEARHQREGWPHALLGRLL